MQRFYSTILTAVCLLILACGGPVEETKSQANQDAAEAESTVDVLAFTGGTGAEDPSALAAIALLDALGKKDGVRVETTGDPEMFRDGVLEDFDVVLWVNTEGDVLNEAQQSAMKRFIQSGNGFVGVHSAAAAEYDWPWYGELVGGYVTEQATSPIRVEITTEEGDHPSTRSLPARFVFSDEINHFDRDIGRDNEVLLAIKPSGFAAADQEDYAQPGGADYPISWYKEFDGGRSWYTALGDQPDTWMHPLFIQHLAGGIQWAAGKN